MNVFTGFHDSSCVLSAISLETQKSFLHHQGWLISESQEERVENYEMLRDIYNSRSQVAHVGLLGKVSSVSENFLKYQGVAEKIGRRLLTKGKPDWNKLVLGTT
jgi:hypothetical protein